MAVCCASGSALAQGADVIVGELPDVSNYAADGAFDAFAVGTTSCNIGTVNLNWYTASNSVYDWDNRHPVIGQNLFRLHNGRFEQIGQAWLKHGFTALAGNLCGTCNGASGTVLGVGCSDPYSSSLNGGQSGLGPKWQVNASDGIFRYPFTNSSGSGTTYKRLRVRTADLNPTTYAGAQYFVEGHYICADDAAAGNDNNNASYRRVTFSGGPSDYTMALTGSTVRQLPAIYAWQAADPTVTITTVDVPGDGRFIVACKVTNNGGMYTYEYAVHNLNSHRSAGSFSVPKPSGATVTNVGFHDVEYHSGEPNAVDPLNPSSDDWDSAVSTTAVTWSGPGYNGTPATYNFHPTVQYMLAGTGTGSSAVPEWFPGTGNDHTANVLRWGTLFNFRFVSDTAPATGAVQIGLWRTGSPTAVFASVPTPGGATGGAPTTGSCCIAGVCSITTAAGCSGNFGGVGTTCTPDPCATGACCNTSGGCTVTSSTGCTGGSTYQGNGTTCSPTNPCPQPTGACCTGTTCSVTTQTACGTGVYIGNGSTCLPTTCASNDFCGGAIPLCDGVSVSGNNSTAGNEGSASCASSGRDVWFKYTPSGTSGTVSVQVTTDNALIPGGTTAFDTVLAIFSACGGTQLACDDDSGTSPGTSSRITYTMTRGVTYIIRLAAYGAGAGGNYSIMVIGGGGTGCQQASGSCCNAGNCSVTTQAGCGSGVWTEGGSCTPNICAPANNDCANRAGIGTGSTPFNNTYATTDGPAHNPGCTFFGNSQIERDLWWNFPSTFTGQLRIDTCGSSFDTKIAVYDDVGCTNYDARLLACNDDNTAASPDGCGAGSLQSSVTINVVPNHSYTIRVGSYGTTAAGAGVLNLTAIPQVTQGACCDADGLCHIVADQAACGSSVFQGVGSTCEPNPCPQPTGACCNGTACTVVTEAACGAGVYQGNNTACGVSGNPTTCCPANYNGQGGLSVQDIFDFLGGYFANDPQADFNGQGGLSVQDIFDFLAAYFAGCAG
jgi:hypothetical protein